MVQKKSSKEQNNPFFSIKDAISSLDPVYFCEKHLIIDNKPFKLSGNGYKPFADIYRYIGIKALEKNAKPVVLVKGRQVGATVMAGALELYFTCSGLFGNTKFPKMRIMHCFPQGEMGEAYSKTTLSALIATSTDDTAGQFEVGNTKSFAQNKIDNSVASNNSVRFKQFDGGNHIWIESIGLDANRIRGRTVDCMFFDEVQDMRKEAILNAVESLTRSQYGAPKLGMQIYLGTPKQKGSYYWSLWNKSTQQYFHLGCISCKEYFPLYTPGSDDWEEIWVTGYIVCCPKCGQEQDKREATDRGKWIASNSDSDAQVIGYHINQLLIPSFTKEQIIAQKPCNHHSNTERKYRNEVLGEFFAGDASPLTTDDIDQFAADMGRKISAGIAEYGGDLKVYAGFDWGRRLDFEQMSDKENNTSQSGKSFSCGVLLVPDGQNLNIVFATKFKKNDMAYKISMIEEIYRKYNVHIGVGDIGDARDLTEELQKIYNDKFLASNSCSQVNGNAKFKNDFFPHTIMFAKDYYLEELIGQIKKGRIRFPYGSYEKIAWLVEHCTSMELKPVKSRSGDISVTYVKGSTPNDGLMALLNAYLAYKFDISRGFTVSDPRNMNQSPSKKTNIPAVVAYIPGMHPSGRNRYVN